MTIKEIIKQYLEEHGYDGLYNEDECACSLDELFPCDGSWPTCKPGYMQPAPEDSGYDFFIVPSKTGCKKCS